jgi:hypothetical protein
VALLLRLARLKSSHWGPRPVQGGGGGGWGGQSTEGLRGYISMVYKIKRHREVFVLVQHALATCCVTHCCVLVVLHVHPYASMNPDASVPVMQNNEPVTRPHLP